MYYLTIFTIALERKSEESGLEGKSNTALVRALIKAERRKAKADELMGMLEGELKDRVLVFLNTVPGFSETKWTSTEIAGDAFKLDLGAKEAMIDIQLLHLSSEHREKIVDGLKKLSGVTVEPYNDDITGCSGGSRMLFYARIKVRLDQMPSGQALPEVNSSQEEKNTDAIQNEVKGEVEVATESV